MALTIKRVGRLTTKGKYADGGGLYLQVHSATNRSWLFRYQLDGQRREMGLGSLKDLTLDQAREAARAARLQKRDGLCPMAERHKLVHANTLTRARDKTFQEVADAYFDFHKDKWQAKWQKDFARHMRDHMLPTLGAIPVSQVDTGLVLQVVEPIWKVTPTTADQVRRRIKDILDYATSRGFRTGDNPARWDNHLKHSLPAVADLAMTEHHAALPYLQAPEFMASLRKVEGVAARALEFTILTCCRTMEVLGAKWDEFDFEAKTWTVPRQRMQKGGGRDADHKVPLCPRAIAILQGLPRLNDYVWPSTKANAGHLAANAMRPQLLALGYAVRVHGFRATFKTWAGETTNFPREVIEMCLAHQVGNAVEQAYQRGDLFAKRSKVHQAWADWLAKPVASAAVLPLRKSVAV